MQAITTKFHGPTNTRGSRVSAKCNAGRITLSWDHALDSTENHDAAARALIKKLDWIESKFCGGELPENNSAHRCYVFASEIL